MGTILLVEDEPDVRELVVHFLSEEGHAVIAAADAEQALAILRQDRPIDMLFTDIVLPGMNGLRLAREAITLRPGLRMLYATGYAKPSFEQEPLLARGHVLGKPYRLASVAEKIAHDLGTPRFALNRVLHRLWRYWAGLKVGSLPSEADVDLRTLFDIADNMAMARIVDGATYRYRFTYFGAVLVKTLGRNPVGAYTQELSRNEYARFLTGLYREVVTTRAGVYAASGFAGAEGLATERLLLPLATDGWNVDAVMAAQTFDRVEDSPTAFDIVERSTRRTDVIERVDRAAAPA